MTAAEKMDIGLGIVYENKKILEHKWAEKLGLHVVDIGGIIDLLEADGYVKKILSEELEAALEADRLDYLPESYYTYLVITIKGDLFWNRQGYSGQLSRDQQNDLRIRQNHTLTKILAFGAAIPSIYYLIEIIKYNPSGVNIQFLLAATIFLLGMIAGIIVYLLTRENK